jgi:competence protein ComEC
MKKLRTLLFLAILFLFTQVGLTQQNNHPTAPPPATAQAQMQIYALDIGQGDSLLIVSPTGKTVLVDTGDVGNQDRIFKALDDHAGGRKIDLFIASHGHSDHIGVADRVIKGSTVATVLDSKFPHTTNVYERYLQAVQQSGAQFVAAKPGQTFDIGGGAKITVLAPIRPYFKQNQLHAGATTPNANSVVVRLDYKSFSMIFTGDAEAETEARMISRGASLKAKVLKVGHHGSMFATSNGFLNAVKPEAAIISVGADNKFHHPTVAALNRLKAAGVRLYRTDLQGEIHISTDGNSYEITTDKTATQTALFTGR